MSVNIILLLFTLGISFYAWNNEDVMAKLIMDSYSVHKRKEYFKFITSGFVHANYMHLFFNMFALYGFGRITEAIFSIFYGDIGPLLYIVFYIAAIIVSEIPSYIKNKTNYNYSSLGASGAISALVIICVIADPFNPNFSFFFVPMPAILMGALYIGYSYYMGRQQFDNINHDAHLYGALFGIIATAILFPEIMVHFYEQVSGKLGF